MTKKDIIVGNWKMFKSVSEAEQFMNDFSKIYANNKQDLHANLQYGLAVPYLDLFVVKANKPADMLVAAQNAHAESSGAYTGEISLDMLQEIGINVVILGHSERRQYFNETNEILNEKLQAALSKNMLPIVCVGETLQQFENNETKQVIKAQLNAIFKNIASSQYQNIVIAYEPIWAIGTGKVATPEIAQDVCAFIRQNTHPDVRIQYGGSVKPENIKEIMSQKDIDGALVGGASLTPESFWKLLTF